MCSGSDDKTVVVWDGMKGKALHRLETPHEGNIFSVVWLAAGEERGLIASGAGDCRICLLDINSSKVLRTVEGHTGRVKRLAVAGDNPGLIWSGSEDGTVRQWDSREKWSEGHSAQNALINNRWAEAPRSSASASARVGRSCLQWEGTIHMFEFTIGEC